MGKRKSMNYLIKLARFIDFEEQEQINAEIQKIINSQTIQHNKRIEFTTKLNEIQLQKIKKIKGINSIHKIIAQKKTQNMKELTEFIIHNSVVGVELKIEKGLPFHAKALNDRLKKQKFELIQGNNYLIEIKKYKTEILTVIMQNIELNELNADKNIQKLLPNKKSDLLFILVEPKTKNEVADFMRLSEIFQVKLILIDSSPHAKQLLNEASERVKSIKSNKLQVKIINSLEKAIQEYYAIGFSLWGNQSEKKLIELKNKKIALIFGNEKKGLPLHTRNLVKEMIRLGPKSSQCMRSSQALAYALALLNN
jgi:tRNA(Leu) C34 or U34 (ribose-2'-O)-methylase TrmL